MQTDLNRLALEIAEEDITIEAGKAKLTQAGKAMIPSIGFEAAVDALADALDIFEQQHYAVFWRRQHERNAINGFRFIAKLG